MIVKGKTVSSTNEIYHVKIICLKNDWVTNIK